MAAQRRPALRSASRSHLRTLRLGAIGSLSLGVALAGLGPVGLSGAAQAAPQVSSTTSTPGNMPDEPTTVRISTFNLLGADHTEAGSKRRWTDTSGQRHRYASGTTRMKWAVQLLRQNDIGVVGMQEMRKSQYDEFLQQVGPDYGIFPGPRAGQALKSNSIAWRSSDWELVEAHTMKIYYFRDMVPMPYVLLRNRTTGREIWVYNSHNPADTRGNAQWRRNWDVRREIKLVKDLRSQDPQIPVFITGDKNDRAKYFCPMVGQSEMQAANGGSVSGSDCQLPPNRPPVDWIMGSSDVRFSGYQALDSNLVRKTTDHRLPFADAFLPSLESAQSGIEHVVMLSVDGLRPSGIRETGRGGTPRIHQMIDQGASTMNARTLVDSVGRLANVTSMLTGLRADPREDGHGLGWPHRGTPSTIAASAGRYVSSILGVTHDFGRSTYVVSCNRDMGVLRRSWNANNGAPDPYVPDNGTAKATAFMRTHNSYRTSLWVARLIRKQQPSFLFAQLGRPASQGGKYGWHSSRYHSALRTTDDQIGSVLDAIGSTPGMADHTVVILTAARGGSSHHKDRVGQMAYFRVPVIVTGPGVPAGSDLYALNPQLTNPGHSRPSYDETQPIRTAYLANLTTRLLGEPPIPGADMDPGQELSVFALPQ